MNKFIATGNLGKDATLGNSGDKKVINFSIGVSSGYSDKKTTFWLECAKWGENTKVIDYLQKGQKVLVTGELSQRTWEKDGRTGTSLCLRCDDIELIGSKAPEQQVQAQPAPTSNAAGTVSNAVIEDDNSLPF